MFCLAQLASFAGGILCVYQSRKWFVIWREVWGDRARSFPWHYEFLINYGWLLLAIPIACVLLIPRHREDDSLVAEDWRWHARASAVSGVILISLMSWIGIEAIGVIFTG